MSRTSYPTLGSRQRRVLEALVDNDAEGGLPIEYSARLNRTICVEWREVVLVDGDRVGQLRWVEDRAAYRIAERLLDLGLVEIDDERFEVRATREGKDLIRANPLPKEK